MLLFRAMKESRDGLPEIGSTARTLGVRPAGDSAKNPDVLAKNPKEIIVPEEGGMSVVPEDPMHLLPHRRPASLGGFGFDPVWKIEADNLGLELQFRQDGPTHGVIEPKRSMTLLEFQAALAKTQGKWRIHCR